MPVLSYCIMVNACAQLLNHAHLHVYYVWNVVTTASLEGILFEMSYKK